MICLAVNTATTITSVALVRDGEVLHCFESAETRDQGNLLVSTAQAALASAGLTFGDIDLFAAVTGPGSFTGIRIGLAAVRGFALAAGKPVVGITSFDMFAAEGGLNLVAVESWREELYFRCGDIIANETPEVFAKRLSAPPTVISGDAAAKIAPFFPQAKIYEGEANAVTVARLAMKMPSDQKPAPYYLREADVNLKLP